MSDKRWAPLIEPMGSCTCCTHHKECEKIRNAFSVYTRFRCPLLIEIEKDAKYGGNQKGWEKIEDEWIWRKTLK